jgi:hypothetical protein
MSDFAATLDAQRTAFKASVGSTTKRKKSLNASTSEVVAQLRSTVLSLTHQVADVIQARLTQATLALQTSNDVDQFSVVVDQLFDETRKMVTNNLNASYDKAKQLAENGDHETQDAVIHLMNQATALFHAMLLRISDFLINAIQTLPEWRRDSDKIKAFFSNLSAFINRL